jgi:hypothetical protein
MTVHLATTTDYAFVNELLTFGEDYKPQVGDTVSECDFAAVDGTDFPGDQGIVVAQDSGNDTSTIRDTESGVEYVVSNEEWFYISESPHISAVWEKHLRRPSPDGIAFGDGLVEPALIARLNEDFERLIALEPVDYHPGSGTRVRDLVPPSLYPYIQGKSEINKVFHHGPALSYDRFGRTYENSKYQWLPTPFHVAEDGSITIRSYINNLDLTRHASTYDDLAALFATALPLIESVVGYVDGTVFWKDDSETEHEGDLPEGISLEARPANVRNLRGRDLLVIPKIVEYRLGAGETHEGVWHVEGMSHEHIIATCVYVLDRDDALTGGELRFKRPYTEEEAGHLFWNISQSRPRAVEALVDEGTVPVGEVATPKGRLVVFPNSHIHKLSALKLADGATEGRRRVIVFWIVDPNAPIPSTAEVPAQQGVLSHEEALAIRLELMEERKRHKQTLNVRAVSLCEH